MIILLARMADLEVHMERLATIERGYNSVLKRLGLLNIELVANPLTLAGGPLLLEIVCIVSEMCW